MTPPHPQHPLRSRLAQATGLLTAPLLALAWAAMPPAALAQSSPDHAPPAGWQQCAALHHDPAARLACFDRWAGTPATDRALAPAPVAAAPASPATVAGAPADDPPGNVPGCEDPRHSNLARFWELESASSCGTFQIRGYRPISLSVIASDGVNKQPTSPNPLNNASKAQPYQTTETRLQLSVRTKLAQGMLTPPGSAARDSLWFGYTQQSYWQLFNPGLSRPFRNTDHEPELIYVYPTDARLPGGWRLRYSGAGLVHQSNGQTLPLSRSWNRFYLMTGMENEDGWRIMARGWSRIPESRANDDNPDIADYVGRAELAAFWDVNPNHTLGLTVRHALRGDGRGSVRLEWLRTLGEREGSLRLHTQLFNGFGDSLIDYNRRRTVLSVGLSLIEF